MESISSRISDAEYSLRPHLIQQVVLRVGVRCCICPLLLVASILSSAGRVVMVSGSLHA